VGAGRTGGRQGLWSLAAITVLTVVGASLIGAALISQEHPPSPSPGARPSTSPRPKVEARDATLTRSEPVSLDIPAIGVHSSVWRVGLDEEGAIRVPAPGPHYNDAAWYKYSPTPGELGPAILVGHVDSAADGPSVFFNLGALRRGDRIAVTREDGHVATFEVDTVRRFSKDRFPTHLVYGRTDHAALRLITCGGPFDNATGHYVDNVVVFASFSGSPG
jgi:sortase (surface protein transpeptidase)